MRWRSTLLIADALVGGNKHIEAGILSSGQQVPVAEAIPSSVFRFRDRLAGEKTGDARWGHMVKENEHLPEIRQA